MKYLGYCALISIIKKLSENQKAALASGKFYQLSRIDEIGVSNEGLVEIYYKLSPTQLTLLKDGYFNQIDLLNSSQHYRARIANHLERLEKYGYDSTKAYMGNDIVEFNELNVPEFIRNSKIWSSVRRRGSKCWYTGEECIVDLGDEGPWSASDEHLIPESRGGKRTRGNIVIAARFTNTRLANAPLHVKLHVRAVLLEKREFFMYLNSSEKVRKIKYYIDQVFDQYKVKGHLPWNTVPKNLREYTGPALHNHNQYEKKFIDRFVGKTHNIKKQLEDICDGMETWQYITT